MLRLREGLREDGLVVAGEVHHGGSEEDAAEGCYLGVGQGVMEVDAGVDADELDKEAANAAEDEVFAGEEAEGEGFGGAAPEPPGKSEREEELVDGSGLDGGGGRVGDDQGAGVLGEAVHHVDAPGEGGVDAVVAIAGEQAADAADTVADGGGRGGEVEHAKGGAAAGEAVGFREDTLVHEHGDGGEQAAVPGKAGLEPVKEVEEDLGGVMDAGEEDVAPGGDEVGDGLELMPELGADDAGEDDHGDDVEGVGVAAVADEVFVQDDDAADGGQPEHEAEGSDVSKTEIQIGIHSGLSIAGRRAERGREDFVRVFLNRSVAWVLFTGRSLRVV